MALEILQGGLLVCDKCRTADGCPRVLSCLRHGARTSLLWDVTQRTLVVTDVSVQPIGAIFKGEVVLLECFMKCLEYCTL